MTRKKIRDKEKRGLMSGNSTRTVSVRVMELSWRWNTDTGIFYDVRLVSQTSGKKRSEKGIENGVQVVD